MKRPQVHTLALVEDGSFIESVVGTRGPSLVVVESADDAVSEVTRSRDSDAAFELVIVSTPSFPQSVVVQFVLVALASLPGATVIIHGVASAPWQDLIGQLPNSERVLVVPLDDSNFLLKQAVRAIGEILVNRSAEPRAEVADTPRERHRRHLEVVGQLAAGVAHEMNTPLQFVTDSVFFVKDGWGVLSALVGRYREALDLLESSGQHADHVTRLRAVESESGLDYFTKNVDSAFGSIDQGLGRMVEIVRALRESAPGVREGASLGDVNKAIRNALTMTRGTWRYIAEVETDLQEVPMVMCHFGELSGAIVNLLVNATHAVEDRWGDEPYGQIRVFSQHTGDSIVIGVEDNGAGISPEIADRIFDPFFSSKSVGRGTGQGLSLARTAIEDRHGGSLTFETRPGEGTTFFVRLPIGAAEHRAAGA